MDTEFKSLRTFIGAKNFGQSGDFYKAIGFQEKVISKGFSLFTSAGGSFYLQDYYVEDWINNTMLFIEVPDAAACYAWLKQLNLEDKFTGIKLLPVKKEDWGDVCHLIDPAGVLLHFGQFK